MEASEARKARGRSKSTNQESNNEDMEAKPAPDVNGDEEKVTSDDKATEPQAPPQAEDAVLETTDSPKDEKDKEDGAPSVEDKGDESASDKNKSRKRKASEMKANEESVSEDGPSEPKDIPADESSSKLTEKEETPLSSLNDTSDLSMPPKQTLGKGKRARIPNKRYSDILLSPQSRSHKSISNLENGDKFEKIEPEPDLSLPAKDPELSSIPNNSSAKSRSNTSSPAPKRTKTVVDVTDPIYRKPFLYGWKRELVYRATTDNTNKRNGDIYYYNPQGKKLRSMREISENLKSKDLTLENFTFFKEPIGLNDPEIEIIRDAKTHYKRGVSTPIASGVKTPKVLSPKVSSPKVAPTPAPKPTPAKIASPKLPVTSKPEPPASSKADTPKTVTSPKNKRPARNAGSLKNLQVKLPPAKSKSEKKAKIEEEVMEVEPSPAKKAANRKTAKAATNLALEGKPCQPCSIRCQGVMGTVPTLQCRLCLCLYHYECVGLSRHVQIEAYVCKNCQLEHGQNVATSASIALPPLTPINSLKSMTTQSTLLPKLQRIPRAGDSAQQNLHPESEETVPPSGGVVVPNMTHLLPSLQTVASKLSKQPDTTAATPQSPSSGSFKKATAAGPSESKSLLGSVTTWLPPSSTIQMDHFHRNKHNEPMEAPPPQYVEYLAGRKFLIIPKHNVVSISPAGAVGKPQQQFDMGSRSERRSLAAEPVDGVTDLTDDTVQTNCIKNEPSSPASNSNIDTEQMDIVASSDKDDEVADGRSSGTATMESELVESPRAKRRATKANNVAAEKIEEPSFMDNYLQNLSYGYNTLLYVFQYLKVQDLLRAGCVCTMWRDIASHPLLWRTVRMKNSQVHSFEGLANTLQKHGTVHLDLRKMLLPTTGGDDIWPAFSKAIRKVHTLRKIELCRCPARVVELLASTNKDLEVINAVTIKCESMSLDMLASLTNLRELRLKSTSGLTLSSDITALQEMTNLRNLSLTSIKDLNKMDLGVISALKNLESLDLGECTDLPENFGSEILIKLQKLEKLRLEKGQGSCHTFEILDAVQNMPQLEQLELVNFDIKTGFDIALGACKNIKKLLVIPTYISQSATTNHMVLGGVLRLQSTLSHFVWGVTLELLRVTELFVDQCEDPDKKDKKDKKPVGNGDSIPVLKPVPLRIDQDDEIPPAHDPPQVEILPLPNLQKLLLQSLPTTRVKILKIPFHATWRQSITDTVN